MRCLLDLECQCAAPTFSRHQRSNRRRPPVRMYHDFAAAEHRLKCSAALFRRLILPRTGCGFRARRWHRAWSQRGAGTSSFCASTSRGKLGWSTTAIHADVVPGFMRVRSQAFRSSIFRVAREGHEKSSLDQSRSAAAGACASGHRPSRAEFAVMLPRHTLASITTVGRNIGICRRQSVERLRRAHEHFARREAGLLR